MVHNAKKQPVHLKPPKSLHKMRMLDHFYIVAYNESDFYVALEGISE